MSVSLGFIGAGAMAESIIQGVLKSGLYQPEEILIADIIAERTAELKQKLKIKVATDNEQLIKQCPVVLLAVKPQVVAQVLAASQISWQKDQLLISIAAGISLDLLDNLVGQIPIVRVMPNTPALVGAGMSALAPGAYAQTKDVQVAQNIFEAVGQTVLVDEQLIDAVTGVSGSGPAYVYQFIEAMADGGVNVGLPRDMAYKLAAQTMVGAGLMVLETGLHPGQLKDMVTSPGGTTIRALNILENAGVRGTIMEAVETAYLWSRKLGSENN